MFDQIQKWKQTTLSKKLIAKIPLTSYLPKNTILEVFSYT